MSRYIEVDALIKQIDSPYTEYPIMIQIRRALKEFINSAPSIDICFCRECKHRGICFGKLVQGIEVVQLNFCSYGQKGDENVETD